MRAFPFRENEVWQIIAFLRSQDESNNFSEQTVDVPIKDVHVSYDEIAELRTSRNDWLTYSGTYNSWRHTSLNHITRANVGQLGVRWIYQFPDRGENIEASPVVRDQVLYMTAPPARVFALNANNGQQLWSYEHPVPPEMTPELGRTVNRGVAILKDKVFVGTTDGRVIALNAANGKEVWNVPVAKEEADKYLITSAPLAYRDLVVTGVATREGGRGFVVAFDADTGTERWRWIAIPSPGSPGSETWAGDSWRDGGGPTWMTGSYDPELDILIWAVGNPKPDYAAYKRRGDNLYCDSAVALRGTTGQFLWHFQFTPADDHDWDANQIPVLADFKSASGIDKRILWANRNGFYYTLDRTTGRYLTGVPFVRQTWTPGLDAKGRPTPLPESNQERKGVFLYPDNFGATNWWSPSYDPQLELLFVPVIESGGVYHTSDAGMPRSQGARTFYTAVRALEATTGKRVWEFRQKSQRAFSAMGGLLSTTTGLVFGSDQQQLFALDSRNGERLWSMETGGKINAAPVSYEANQTQFVAIASGRNLLALALPGTLAATSDSQSTRKKQ
jgi:alcohol dehydrogenase (cytochrome c)